MEKEQHLSNKFNLIKSLVTQMKDLWFELELVDTEWKKLWYEYKWEVQVKISMTWKMKYTTFRKSYRHHLAYDYQENEFIDTLKYFIENAKITK